MKEIRKVILAGGKSTRMGEDKGKLKIEGETFLNRLVKELYDVEPILISLGQGNYDSLTEADSMAEAGPAEDISSGQDSIFKCEKWNTLTKEYEIDQEYRDKILWVEDMEKYAGAGPLAGIYSAMAALSREENNQPWNNPKHKSLFVAACDMPYLSKELYENLAMAMGNQSEEVDAIVPIDEEGREHPLAAIYSLGVRDSLKAYLDSGGCRVKDFLNSINTKYITIEEKADRKELSNMNRKEDYENLIKRGKKPSLEELAFLSFCLVMGMFAKKLISPATNILTDFIRLPGGGLAAAFSIMFLVVAAGIARWRWAGTTMGFIQGVLTLFLGMSGYQGALGIITFTIPGFLIDICRMLWPKRDSIYYVGTNAVSNGGNALISNLLVFHFKGSLLVLWLLVAISAGIIFGYIGSFLNNRLTRWAEYRSLKRKAEENMQKTEGISIREYQNVEEREIQTAEREKEKKKRMKRIRLFGRAIVAVILLVTIVTACAATKDAKGAETSGITIEGDGKTVIVSINDLDQEEFSGTQVNGKGEESEYSYRGIELKALLEKQGIALDTAKGVTITSADNYSAEYTIEEVLEGGIVYLAVQQDGEKIEGIGPGTEGINVVVFGDPNSKRCVRYVSVVRID